MALYQSFYQPAEDELSKQFFKQGYVLLEVDDRSALLELRQQVVQVVCDELKMPFPTDDGQFLNDIHKHLPVEKLNALRLATFNRLNNFSWFRPTYYALARSGLTILVGNELAMQNKVNLSIQYPDDESSLLAVHADAWSAETPFQVVVWLPLVNVFDTKSMYILDPSTNRSVVDRFKQVVGTSGSEGLFAEYRGHFKWLEIPFGKVMIFSPNLLHGNVVNRTGETRWSFNTRFTGLFTPYVSEEKRLGNFYLPITTKPVSRIGLSYREPGGFDE